MLRYRTEIHVAPDRYVWIKLPDAAPEGPAMVSVEFLGIGPGPQELHRAPVEGRSPADDHGRDEDRDDIEWWEEFEEGGASGG